MGKGELLQNLTVFLNEHSSFNSDIFAESINYVGQEVSQVLGILGRGLPHSIRGAGVQFRSLLEKTIPLVLLFSGK